MSTQSKNPNEIEIHDPSEPWDNPTLLNNRPSHTGELWRKARANIEQSQRNFVAPNILRSRNLNFIRESQRAQNNLLEKNSNSKFPQPVKKVGMEGGEGDNEDHNKKSKKNDHKPADTAAKNMKQKVKRKIVLFIMPYFFGFIGIASIFMLFLVAINIDWCDVAGVVAGDGIAGGAVRASCNLLSPGTAEANIAPQRQSAYVTASSAATQSSRLEASLRANLASRQIYVSSTGNCSDPNNPSCTSLASLPASTLNTLVNIRQACPQCGITITGGAETGHQSHGAERPVVDIAFNQATAEFLKNRSSEYGVTKICTTVAHERFSMGCGNFRETQEHLHVEF